MRTSEYLETEKKNIEIHLLPELELVQNMTVRTSPSGKFSVRTRVYRDEGVGTDGVRFQHTYLRSMVQSGKDEVFSYNGCVHDFVFWIEDQKGKSFLLCTEHYQGYGVLALDTLEYKFHFPDEGVEGSAFIWTKCFLSSNSKYLAVDGCVWGGPYQIKVFDVENIMSLPYQEVLETDFEFWYDSIVGWADNQTLRVKLLGGEEDLIRINEIS